MNVAPQQTGTAPATPIPQSPAGIAVLPQLPAPRTAEEIRGIRAQREELSNQLNSAQGRRKDVARDLAKASPAAAPGLQRRLDVLDARIAQIETDINATGRQLTTAPPNLPAAAEVSSRSFPGGVSPGQTTAISIVFIVAVLAPIAVAWARGHLRRLNSRETPIDRAQAERLERLEHAVDSIAVEMERVSEGQRFLTNVLTAGPAKPIGTPETPDAVPTPVRDRNAR
jgi:hypothetical protein